MRQQQLKLMNSKKLTLFPFKTVTDAPSLPFFLCRCHIGFRPISI